MNTNTVNVNGKNKKAPEGAIAWKYADDTEGARWVYDQADATEIAREDPSLLEWVKNPAAVTLGRKGGQSTSPAKTSAARSNGQAGGRPSLRERAAARVENSPTLRQYTNYIMADWPEGREHWRWVLTAPVREIVDWCEAGK